MKKINVKTIGDEGTFNDIVTGASKEINEIANALRALVAEVMPGVTEVSWKKQRIAGYGVGPKKMSEQFCYIAPLKQHVNLGFYYGADLNDPTGLLEGEGKALRHIKIRSLDLVSNPKLKKLIKQASTHLPHL